MKKNILIANWKMNLDLDESVGLAKYFSENIKDSGVEVVLCPSLNFIDEVGEVLKGKHVGLGAQDVFWEGKGAYTGEAAPEFLKKAGCSYCIVGHSERRKYLNETDEMVNKKVKALLSVMIKPVICIGESLEQREKGLGYVIVEEQLRLILDGVKPVGAQEIIIAYEPVWAISTSGSGRKATPELAEEMNNMIRSILGDLYPADILENNFRLIYGGSTDAENVGDFVKKDDIFGALVGGASLKKNEFLEMIEAIK